MIGNTIQFLHYKWDLRILSEEYKRERERTREERLKTGLVVDAYTEVTGSTSGKSSTILGFGDGSVSGSTKSQRMYKVQYFESYSETPYFLDIQDWQLVRIISFAGQTNQETHEEKFKTSN